jgi:conjugative transfer signal peptidase TraF
MNRRLPTTTTAALLTGAGLTAITTAFLAMGLIINITPSLPVGIYKLSPISRLHRGEYVSICPPDTAPFRLARRAGYVPKGPCPGDYLPLMKPIAGLPGDQIVVGVKGIAVNGAHIPLSRAYTHDGAGRALPRIALGVYTVGPGEVWLVSHYNERSFDSRYFGAVQIERVKASTAPVFTWGPADPHLILPDPPRANEAAHVAG